MKLPADPRRRKAEQQGRQAEQQAADFLQSAGWEILATRVKTRSGEIDLIAAKQGVTAFIEVKARASRDEALLAVTPRQAKRIIAAANYWLAANPKALEGDCRFDIILVSHYLNPEHIENAFGAEAW
jgi:putative endonuclease